MRIWQTLIGKLRFFLNRTRERLWVKPLVMCVVSVAAAFVAGMADRLELASVVPEVSSDSIKTLLQISASSMLVIAVFAVGAMLSAYTSASNSATPRSFSLVVSDDVSQNALSSFIGAFIFSIIALIALMNGYYGKAGLFVLFLLTVFVFVIVILSFVRWVDRIARLGRMSNTVDKVEEAAERALRIRRERPSLDAGKASDEPAGVPVFAEEVGYVQRIDIADLQAVAENLDARIHITAIQGALASADKPLAYVEGVEEGGEFDLDQVRGAFSIGDDRTFDEDPRFGLIVLAEIASRALSPALNDPGTAIDIIGTFVRLFTIWAQHDKDSDDDNGATRGDKSGEEGPRFDRVQVPVLTTDDLFDDAFNAIARDGAAIFEVCVRLQKALRALAAAGDEEMSKTARKHARLALRHAEASMKLPEEVEKLREVAQWAHSDSG